MGVRERPLSTLGWTNQGLWWSTLNMGETILFLFPILWFELREFHFCVGCVESYHNAGGIRSKLENQTPHLSTSETMSLGFEMTLLKSGGEMSFKRWDFRMEQSVHLFKLFMRISNIFHFQLKEYYYLARSCFISSVVLFHFKDNIEAIHENSNFVFVICIPRFLLWNVNKLPIS